MRQQQTTTTTTTTTTTATTTITTTTNNRIKTAEFPIYMEYTRQQRFNRPIRIELYLAKALLRDECSQDSHCGHRMICCHKQWYDLSADSGTGYFCLPNCELTKKVSLGIHEADGLIPNDIIYD
ncbi:unnamed protein product [Cercopithifilaria johnstoni]|uniref:Uncharacterized protein n=1 Tax=Cercopithifilaria johnstoni TaxID=2874296 RepID=A0A8J2M3V2_9BILA|nr:unnamed protein product [Cercopithifilaria johnstoni]